LYVVTFTSMTNGWTCCSCWQEIYRIGWIRTSRIGVVLIWT